MILADLCACIMAHAPSVEDVLERARESTVCTAVQCFPSQQDAFGVHAPPASAARDDLVPMAALVLSSLYALAVFARARRCASK